ncbi:hypothetical protein BKA70DRAFT_792926 [Coprinopsis sp. MPI-PUGE-AT-0042]|nr:hypothetical protein BKA70DRAFT_792926 [Coprinopsis sp. MPI-PUGE-AT-0042]
MGASASIAFLTQWHSLCPSRYTTRAPFIAEWIWRIKSRGRMRRVTVQTTREHLSCRRQRFKPQTGLWESSIEIARSLTDGEKAGGEAYYFHPRLTTLYRAPEPQIRNSCSEVSLCTYSRHRKFGRDWPGSSCGSPCLGSYDCAENSLQRTPGINQHLSPLSTRQVFEPQYSYAPSTL